jgi:hypothetical protein
MRVLIAGDHPLYCDAPRPPLECLSPETILVETSSFRDVIQIGLAASCRGKLFLMDSLVVGTCYRERTNLAEVTVKLHPGTTRGKIRARTAFEAAALVTKANLV